MTSCFTKQLLHSNLHYQLENSCYPNSSLTGTLYRSIISLHVHHAYLNTAQNQNIWVYSTLTHQVGGRVFLRFCASPLALWLSWIVLIFVDFATNFLSISPCQHWPIFLCLFFYNMIWLFLWHVSNVRQRKIPGNEKGRSWDNFYVERGRRVIFPDSKTCNVNIVPIHIKLI